MPIRPENRDRYPPSWREISYRIRSERADWRCECLGECGLDHSEDDDQCGPPHDRCQANAECPHPRTGDGMADVKLIAAANPEAILSLIAWGEAAERERDKWKELVSKALESTDRGRAEAAESRAAQDRAAMRECMVALQRTTWTLNWVADQLGPGAILTRSELIEIEMPRFASVANREAVIFDGADPETAPTPTPTHPVE